MAWDTVVAADSPRIWLKLEETSGASWAGNSGAQWWPANTGAWPTFGNSGGEVDTVHATWAGTGAYNSDSQTANSFCNATRGGIEAIIRTTDTDCYIGEAGNTSDCYALGIDSNGKLKAFYGSQTLTSSASVNTGNWVHVAMTRSNIDDTLRLFINGAQVASTSTTDIGTVGGRFVAAGGTQSKFSGGMVGDMDEIMSYNTEIANAIIVAHAQETSLYTASASVSASVVTASSEMRNPSVTAVQVINTGYTAQLMEASQAEMPNAEQRGQIVFDITVDTYIDSANPSTPYGTNSAVSIDGTSKTGFFGTNVSLPAQAVIHSATLNGETNQASDSDVVNLYQIDSSWVENVTYATAPSVTYVTTKTLSTDAGRNFSLDVSDIVEQWASGTANHGIAIRRSSTGTVSIYSGESSGYDKPQLVIEFSSPSSLFVNADEASATAAMLDPEFTAPIDVAADVLTASLEMLSALGAADGSAVIAAEEMTANAVFLNAVLPNVIYEAGSFNSTAEFPFGQFRQDYTATGNVWTGPAEMLEATVSTVENVTVSFGTMKADAMLIPTGNEDITDAYYDFLRATTDSDDLVLLLDERSGTFAYNSRSMWSGQESNQVGGEFVNAAFNVFGPESRPAVRFGGDGWINIVNYYGGGVIGEGDYTNSGSHEIVFRTSEDGLLIDLQELLLNIGTVHVIEWVSEAAIENGFLRLTTKKRWMDGSKPDEVKTMRGFIPVADGQWHHLVITRSVNVGQQQEGGYMEVYVDGELDFRRYASDLRFTENAHYIGGSPENSREGLVGDIMNYVFRNKMQIWEDAIIEGFYNAFGIIPVRAGQMRGTAEILQADTRGNKSRILALYYDETIPGTANAEAFDPENMIYTWGTGDQINRTEVMGDSYIMTYQSLWKAAKFTGDDFFRDERTWKKRFIDLQKDIDIEYYDAVTIMNLPETSDQWVSLGNTLEGDIDVLWDGFLKSLRAAVDNGCGLWINNPKLAADMGIIDAVELVPFFHEEQVNSNRGYNHFNYNPRGDELFDSLLDEIADYNAASGDRMAISLPNGDWYAWDTHAGNKYRLVNTIEGLTDQESWIMTEILSGFGYEESMPPIGVHYEDRTSGLQIGDEWFVPSDPELIHHYKQNSSWGPKDRFDWVAVPPSAVKAGTVVTAIGERFWAGNPAALVDNVYRDYATTIVLEPGDELDGSAVGGRIFVNFMESWDKYLTTATYIQDKLTHDKYVAAGYTELSELPAFDQYWQNGIWHLARTSASAGVGSNSGLQVAITEDGEQIIQPTSTGGTINSTAWVSRVQNISVPFINMVRRGIKWISERSVQEQGDKTVFSTKLTAAASMPTPAVSAEKEVIVNAGTALALASMGRVAEASSSESVIPVLPMQATAAMMQFTKSADISAEAMEADALLSDFLTSFAGGEQVTLFLHNKTANLYLEDS